MQDAALADHRHLVQALLDPACYPHPVGRVEHLETHISDVLLAGEFAYKLKKPVTLGFLDFASPAARRHYCHEELRLNRRAAASLYLAVVAVRQTADGPRWDLAPDEAADGTPPATRRGGLPAPAAAPLAYAVKMRRFAQESLFDRMLAAGRLEGAHIDALADRIAAFHATVARAGAGDRHGLPEQALAAALANFRALREHAGSRLAADPSTSGSLDRLEHWTRERHVSLAPALAARRAGGFVRECHGDLHSGNIAWVDGDAQLFDCIEFSDELRWIDVASEMAFAVMDLHAHGHPGFANRLLDRWLQASGDYSALAPMGWFVVYRALVRAKVAAIRAAEPGVDPATHDGALAAMRRHVALAESLRGIRRPWLVITHGVSGSGKTTLAQRLLEATGAVRLRSDVERKRLHGLRVDAASGSPTGGGIYTPAAGEATYARLRELAQTVIGSGRGAIVDATFLQRAQRDHFAELARELGVPFAILDCSADLATLRARILARRHAGSDASEATLEVLERQLRECEPITATEMAVSVRVSGIDADTGSWLDALRARVGATRA